MASEKTLKFIEDIKALSVMELAELVDAIQDALGLGLKEAKEVVESAPKALKEGVSKAEAEELKTKLEGAGATIEIK